MRTWWRARARWARFLAVRDLSRRLDRGEVSRAEALDELDRLEGRGELDARRRRRGR